ncbi:MAG: hypothetical protein J6S85_13565 [Methanobrevibacter sp.]|nr:hypothetical protein [Methanobrevibacter sp.]
MTKERLEEIRKQKGTVYTVFDNDKEATPLILDEKCNDNNILAQAYFCLSNLWETKEQAEWHNKTYAERTERFEPPMWEEIKDKYSFAFMGCKNCVVRFIVFKNYNSLNHIIVYSCLYDEDIYYDISTKETYEKACEIVRDLFKGEK